MSLSYQKLKPLKVKDPRIIIDNAREYAVLSGGKKIQQKQYTSTSISNSSIQFSCPPPSGGFIVDRKMYFVLPVRLTFAGSVTGSTTTLLNPNCDAPRAYPISSAIDVLQVTINNTSVSINMSDIIHALLHYNTDVKLKEYDYSMTATCPDQAQNYFDLNGAIRNPLGPYGDSNDESVMGRGGVQFTIVAGTNTSTAAIVDMVICEPLFLSPFYWGHSDASGFANVTSMDFNFTFLTNAGTRMWSHNNIVAGTFGSPTGTSTISSVSVQFNQMGASPSFSYGQSMPFLLFTYIAPQDTEIVNPLQPITYPYFDIARYPTDFGATTTTDYSAGAFGNGTPWNSNNIQLATIPRRMYIYARPSNSWLQTHVTETDTYLGISNLNIQFNGDTYLSSASQQQLYVMSLKNGLNMSWQQFSGQAMYPIGSFANPIGGIGSVCCVEFGTDIPLSPYEAPGINGQYNLLVQASVYQCDPTTNHNETPYTLYLVIVSEGTFTVEKLGASMTQLGVLSKQDVLDSRAAPFVSYKDVEEVNGGNFLSGLKNFGSKLLDGIQKVLPFLSEGFNIAKSVAPLIGLGEGGTYAGEGVVVGGRRRMRRGQGVYAAGNGGVVVGGRTMSRADLRNRLRYDL